MTTKQLTARQARWAKTISSFRFKLMYRAGKLNERGKANS